MKTSHLVALLKNDSRMVWPCLVIAIFYTYLSATDYRQDQMFVLTPSGGAGSFLFMIPFLMWNFLFQNQGHGLKAANAPSFSSLEFMFTRAINRASLFCTKSALYLILSALPLVLIWAYSYTAPIIRVELPYNSHQHREETKQFYLAHFEGTYLQEPDNGKNKDYVVLPKGRANQAAYIFFLAFSFTLLFQTVLFTFARMRWLPFVTLLAFVVLLPFAGLSAKTPSLYEASLAWVTQHTPLAFLGLGLLTVLAQLYCCRRFVNTEITS